MKCTSTNRLVSFILCGVLIAAMALTLIGCNDTKTPLETSAETATVKGEGATVFYLNVISLDRKVTPFEIHTDKATVGEALVELGLIAGDPGEFGLYVKTVNNVTIDPDTNPAYWAFYEGDTYAATGVDKTAITPGATYAFRAEKS